MATENSREHLAAVDLGSNSFRLLIAPAGDPGAAAVRTTVTVGLGRGRGRLRPETAARGIRVLAGFAREIASRGVPAERVRACGTEALRRAADRDGFIRRAEEVLGHPIEVLSGREEARLTMVGALAGMDRPGDGTTVADIGGGSTEAVHCRGREAAWSASVPMGAIRAAAMLGEAGEAKSAAAVARALEPLGLDRPAAGLALCGGSATTCVAVLLGLDPYDPAAVQGHALGFAEVCDLFDRLRDMDPAGLARVRGLPPDRAPLIAGGLLVIREVMRQGGFATATVSDYGLLEGIFLSIAAR